MKAIILGTVLIAAQPTAVFANEQLESLLEKSKYQALEQSVTDKSQLSYWQGRAALHQDKLDQAEALLEKAASAFPKDADKQFWFGVVNLKQASNASIFSAPGYAKRGKAQLEKVLSIDPKHKGALSAMFEYMLHAPSIVGGSTTKARQLADELNAIDQNVGAIHYLKLYRKLEDKAKEQKAALKILNTEKSNAAALLSAGFSFQRAEHFDLAHQAFTQASLKASEKGQYTKLQSRYQIGKTAVLSNKNINEGIDSLQLYIASEINNKLPEKSWANYRLASLLLMNNEPVKAREIVHSALANIEDKDLKKRVKVLKQKLSNI